MKLPMSLLLPLITLCIYNTYQSVPPGNLPGQYEQTEKPCTSLLEAAERRDVSEAERLLDKGDDVNARDVNQRSPLDIAISQERPSIDLIRELIKGGAQIDGSISVSVPHPDPPPESSPSRSPVSSDSETGTPPTTPRASDAIQTIPVHVPMPLQVAAKKADETIVKELYLRGAYPPPEDILQKQSPQTKNIIDHHEPIARDRVKTVHGWLAPRLGSNKDLEELIRSMEISSKKEGEAYYWGVIEQEKKKNEEE